MNGSIRGRVRRHDVSLRNYTTLATPTFLDEAALGLGASCGTFGGRIALDSCNRGCRMATFFKLVAVRRLRSRLDGA